MKIDLNTLIMIVIFNELPNHLKNQLHVILSQKNEKFTLFTVAAKFSDINLCSHCLKNWIRTR